MLLSWVIVFKPIPLAIPANQARALESVFLEWVRQVDPEYAQELHNSQIKPFTVSDLQGRIIRQHIFTPETEPFPDGAVEGKGSLPSDQLRVFAADQVLWWRITTFSPRLSQLMVDQIRPALPSTIRLEHCDCTLTIDQHSLAEIPNHRWAGHNTYQDLAQRFLLTGQRPLEQVKIHFASPTAFHKDENFWLFPSAEQVVESWLRRWNAFSQITFPAETRQFVARSLVVSRYRLSTLTVSDKELQIGFQGICTYRFVEQDPYWMRVIHTLSAFSFYCGTGIKTARGMGQTRRLYETPRPGVTARQPSPGMGAGR
jgi:CRISPR-associated endoribonuclease Cas6